ncbi:MAG: N-acyl-D-amino-acid deacylase family protein [Chloroflexota bacterium]
MDVIIRNANVLDGTGSPAFPADIGLAGERIAAIGDLAAASAPIEIDAAGLTAAPGFIDIHSHSDFTLPINPRAESKIRQGVTTEVIGMCGSSPAPLTEETRQTSMAAHPDLPWEWTSFGEFLDFLRRQGTSVNLVPMVGHGAIRGAGMGLAERAPTPAELAAMKRLVAQAMDEGAWGLSTGLIYAPSVYATTDEIVALSRVAAERGGFYFSHIRGEEATLLEAVAEAIEIGERARLPVQIAHFKAARPENWGLLPQALALVDDARARGLDVAADRYPYIASSTSLGAYLPDWAHDGGRNVLLERLQSPDARRRILDDLVELAQHWERIVISHAPLCPELEGMSVAEVAGGRGNDPNETALDVLLEGEGRVSVVHFGMSEENLKTVLRHPAVMIGSDGSARIPEGPLGEGKAHPRSYGTFVRVLGKYARQEGVLTMAEAVHKMTGLPAARLGLSDRGRLVEGLKADVVLFDPETVIDRATFTEPYQYPAGIVYVLVNGQTVITPQGHTGALPGQILKRGA